MQPAETTVKSAIVLVRENAPSRLLSHRFKCEHGWPSVSVCVSPSACERGDFAHELFVHIVLLLQEVSVSYFFIRLFVQLWLSLLGLVRAAALIGLVEFFDLDGAFIEQLLHIGRFLEGFGQRAELREQDAVESYSYLS